MKNTEYFEYIIPFWKDLKKEVEAPYRFEDDIMDNLDRLFSSPRHKWHKVTQVRKTKYMKHYLAYILYIYVKYGRDNMSLIGHSLDNITGQICVTMWKHINNFHYGKDELDEYYPTDLDYLVPKMGLLVEKMIKIQNDKKYIWSNDDMVKVRKGIGLRETRARTQEGQPYFEYLVKLGEDYN